MTSFGPKSIKHLGTIHGEGTLLIDEGRHLGQVTYEIDEYLDRGVRSANGQIEAEGRILEEASRAKDATIVLESGRCVHVIVSHPSGGAAEVRVADRLPLRPAPSEAARKSNTDDVHHRVHARSSE